MRLALHAAVAAISLAACSDKGEPEPVASTSDNAVSAALNTADDGTRVSESAAVAAATTVDNAGPEATEAMNRAAAKARDATPTVGGQGGPD